MRDVSALLGKTATITFTTNKFGQHWVGQSGKIVGEVIGGLGVVIDVAGTEVWSFWGNFRVQA